MTRPGGVSRRSGKRFAAFMLLEASLSLHARRWATARAAQRVDITIRHLPNPSGKGRRSFRGDRVEDAVGVVCDKERAIAGENRWLIPDGLLQCSMEASSKEVFDAVTRIVEEVAEEYGANAAVAVSKAKAYVAENADESDELAPWDLGEEVFEDEPLQKRFEQALADEALPERSRGRT